MDYQPDLCSLLSSSLRCLSISRWRRKAWSSYSVMILPRISNISPEAAAESRSFTRDFSACNKAMSQSYQDLNQLKHRFKWWYRCTQSPAIYSQRVCVMANQWECLYGKGGGGVSLMGHQLDCVLSFRTGFDIASTLVCVTFTVQFSYSHSILKWTWYCSSQNSIQISQVWKWLTYKLWPMLWVLCCEPCCDQRS